ncbi:MAG TPA: serine--tRNA ligase [Candidatus Aquilonibacter sp.]|nr:serine--tRNA ligase [Candidatus Aquilonibacter sp.]
MLDLAFVRANLALVEEKLRQRGADTALFANFAALDTARRSAITEVETLKAQRNALSQQIGQLKREGKDVAAVTLETTSLKERIAALESRATDSDNFMRALLHQIPNLPHDSVPVGASEQDNQLEKTWGEPVVLPNARPHWELGEQLGILDFARAAKISGARFVIHYGAGARLERALAAFMLDLHTRLYPDPAHAYTEVLPPYMVNSKSLFGTGQLPKFAEDLFHCDDKGPYIPGELQGSDHWLIPTAEVPVTNIFRDEVIDLSAGTVSFCAYTPCFRSEAGSHGKDTRGMIRQHQFQKVELVKFARPEDSYAEHERLTRDAERVLEALELPYRRMLLCTADMGFSSAKTFDLEVWLPGQQTYREISSCSNFESFQARRANIKYKPSGSNKAEFLHTLNGSGLAVGRTYLAILENYQQPDGSVRIPSALQPYMHGETVITPQRVRGIEKERKHE